MATIIPTFAKIIGRTGGVEAMVVTWVMGNADKGQAVQLPGFPDKSVQFEGTFGGATVVFEGSNADDGTGTGGTGGAGDYETLNDAFGNSLSFSAKALKQVTEITSFFRPQTSGGSGTALTITATCRRPFR